jgi:putative membrane protein
MERRHGLDTEAGRKALLEAAACVERDSGAEVVVAVHARSAHYLHAHVLLGAATGVGILWFQLFSPWEYSLVSILVAPVVAGFVVALLTEAAPALQRLLSPSSLLRSSVLTAAQSMFHELGVSATRGRTGALVYVSRLERDAEIVLDRAVAPAAALHGWADVLADLRRAVAANDAARAAMAVKRLAPLLAAVAPRGADDVNELTDAVRVA